MPSTSVIKYGSLRCFHFILRTVTQLSLKSTKWGEALCKRTATCISADLSRWTESEYFRNSGTCKKRKNGQLNKPAPCFCHQDSIYLSQRSPCWTNFTTASQHSVAGYSKPGKLNSQEWLSLLFLMLWMLIFLFSPQVNNEQRDEK